MPIWVDSSTSLFISLYKAFAELPLKKKYSLKCGNVNNFFIFVIDFGWKVVKGTMFNLL